MNTTDFDLNEDANSSGGGGLSQIPAILKDRRWYIAIPLVIGSIAGLASIFVIPTTYRSSATILVQSPQLPSDILGDAQQDNVDRRIAAIREQITSRPDLLALMDQHSLYLGQRERQPLSKVIETMREAITLTPTTASSLNDSAKDRTISFELTYDYEAPEQAQAVAQDLMERLLELDSSQNSSRASSTSQFLTDQASSLQQQILEIEGQIAAITSSNGQALSGAGVVAGGNTASIDMQIWQLQRDNAALLTQRETIQGKDFRDPGVVAAENLVAALRSVYSDSHPDVVVAKQRLAEAKAQMQSRPTQNVLQQIDQQIAFNNSQMSLLRATKASEEARLSSSISAQSRGPLVQQQISQLQQKLAGLNSQYQSISTRLMSANANVRAGSEQMGQKLTVVEPPVVPDAPHWPNRPLLISMGVAGGLALGLMLAFLVEMILRPIRSPETLAAISGRKPLAVVPQIDFGADKNAKPRWWQKLPFIRRKIVSEA